MKLPMEQPAKKLWMLASSQEIKNTPIQPFVMSIAVFNIQQKLFSRSQYCATIKEHDSVDYFSQVNIKTISKKTFGNILLFTV